MFRQLFGEPADNSDEKLIAQFQAGNDGAFSALVDRYFIAIYRFLRGRLKNADDAEDCTQDVNIKAFFNRDSFDPAFGTILSWMKGIARNVFCDFCSRAGRNRTAITAIAQEKMAELAASSTERSQIDEERVDLLYKAMRELSDHERIVVTLLFQDGLSYDEVAKQTGIPSGTVGSHRSRAISKLRAALGVEV